MTRAIPCVPIFVPWTILLEITCFELGFIKTIQGVARNLGAVPLRGQLSDRRTQQFASDPLILNLSAQPRRRKWTTTRVTGCYDFKNIFAENFSEKRRF
jgi:hypothetical protein